jgi:hypothetical protein
MAGRYEIWLTDDAGVRIKLLDDFISASFTKEVNAIAPFSLSLKATFDIRMIKPDRMIQVWRAPGAGQLRLWQAYFVRGWQWATLNGEDVRYIFGSGPNDLLRRRIVAAYAETAQTDKTAAADDMMKEVVTESIADGVAPVPTAGTRVIPLSVQVDSTDGPVITRAFAWQRLLLTSGGGAIGGTARAALEAGTEVFFAVVAIPATNAISFEFRTYTGQPGRDITKTGFTFDQDRGNMANPSWTYDATEEANYIYSGGKGAAAARHIEQVYDTARYGVSQWGRCEAFANANNTDVANAIREEGREKLETGRPVEKFSAIPVDTKGSRYGIHWNFGDRVLARYLGHEFETIVRAVTIILNERGKEDIRSRLDADVT